MRRLVVASLALALTLGSGVIVASEEEVGPAPGAFSPAGVFSDFTRGGGTPVLLADGRVLVLAEFGTGAEVWDPETFTFKPAGAFPKPRYSYSATLLPDGRVLVVGGSGRSRDLASAKLWDPATESFSPAGNLATARSHHDAVPLPDGRVLIVGGCCDERGRVITSAEVWDPAKRRFEPAGALSTPREHATVTALRDGRVLVIGGIGPDAFLATAEVWDPAIGAFTAAGTMAVPHAWHTAVLLPDGRVLVLGGESDTAEVWDPTTMTFSPAGVMEPFRNGHSTTLLSDGRVLVVGGEGPCDEQSGACESLTSAEVWDPATLGFGPAGTLARGRLDHTATLLPDGRVLVFGGNDDADWRTPWTAEVWDPATMTFSPAGAFDRVRFDYRHVDLPDGRVLVIGGTDDGDADDAIIWDPTLFEPGLTVPAPSMDRATAEARLLAGVRPSIRSACRRTRGNLPEGALAGVDCQLGDPTVRRVRAYLFREQSDMLKAYFSRLEQVGLDRARSHSGRCEPDRASEGPYHPTRRKDQADYPARDGCFYDRSGRAHYISTSPPYVMSEVIGRVKDFDTVRDWAWAGHEGDIPGGPNVAG